MILSITNSLCTCCLECASKKPSFDIAYLLRGDLRLCAEEKPLTIQLPINQEYAVYNFPFFVNERAEQKYRVNSNSRTYHGIADSHLD